MSLYRNLFGCMIAQSWLIPPLKYLNIFLMYQNWKAEYFLSLSQNHPKFPILKVFWINWSYIEKSEQNICACLSRHETNFGATLSGSTYLIPTSLYSNSFARNLLMFKSGCIFLNFSLHSPALNISSETSSQKLGRHALHRVRWVWQSLG